MTAMTANGGFRSEEALARSAWRRSLLVLAGLVGAVLVLAYPVVESMVNVWWGSATYNHCFFVAPIAAFLVWLRRDRVAQLRPRAEPLALVPVTGASILLMLGELADVNLVQHVALVGLVMSLCVFILGREIAWELKFPIAFLVFLVPVGDSLVPALQDFTATFSVALLRAIDIPTFHDGILIQTPSGLFEVAEACAGIRFLIANIVIAVLYAHLAYDHLWKMAAFVAMGIVVPIIANGLRAFGIIYIAYLTDNEYAVGVDHIVYGWGFFAAIMLLLLFLGSRFADRRPGDPPTEDPWLARNPGRPIGPVLAVIGAVLVLGGPAYASYLLGRDLSAHRPPAVETAAFPVEGWRLVQNPDSDWSPAFESADANFHLAFQKEGETPVDLFIAWYTHQRPGHKVVYYANTFHQPPRWLRLDTREGRLNTGATGLPEQTRFHRIGANQRTQRIVASWYWVNEEFAGNAVEAKIQQLVGSLSGGEDAAAVIAFSAPYDLEAEEAIRRIESLLADTRDLRPWLSETAERARADAADR